MQSYKTLNIDELNTLVTELKSVEDKIKTELSSKSFKDAVGLITKQDIGQMVGCFALFMSGMYCLRHMPQDNGSGATALIIAPLSLIMGGLAFGTVNPLFFSSRPLSVLSEDSQKQVEELLTKLHNVGLLEDIDKNSTISAFISGLSSPFDGPHLLLSREISQLHQTRSDLERRESNLRRLNLFPSCSSSANEISENQTLSTGSGLS